MLLQNKYVSVVVCSISGTSWILPGPPANCLLWAASRNKDLLLHDSQWENGDVSPTIQGTNPCQQPEWAGDIEVGWVSSAVVVICALSSNAPAFSPTFKNRALCYLLILKPHPLWIPIATLASFLKHLSQLPLCLVHLSILSHLLSEIRRNLLTVVDYYRPLIYSIFFFLFSFELLIFYFGGGLWKVKNKCVCLFLNPELELPD